jgi:nicotinate phosphoribosyltransferase
MNGVTGTELSALALDLYELTMAQSYIEEGMEASATFSLFVRNLPPERGYLVAAGLDDALDYLERLAFSADDLAYLNRTGLFRPEFLDRLAALRFTGSVRAMPEGTVCFAEEPLLEVTAPVVEAQLVETAIINEIQLQTMVASKAARCVTAARGRSLADFGLRRTHGLVTGLKVARASYLAGFDSTSNVLAGKEYGIPTAGTMAHSYVEAFPSELDAFRAYARAYPDRAVLLVDTYGTIEGTRRAALIGQELAANGHRLRGVRIDSGDVIGLSREARRILDDAGLAETIIVASGGLDEYTIENAVRAGAPIDTFGVGTRMSVSADAPHLDLVYKLVAADGRPTLKLSADKATWPAAKQVWRRASPSQYQDWIGLEEESAPAGAEPLLVKVMVDGCRIGTYTLEEARGRAGQSLALLPPRCLQLAEPEPIAVEFTEALKTLRRELSDGLSGTTPRSSTAGAR